LIKDVKPLEGALPVVGVGVDLEQTHRCFRSGRFDATSGEEGQCANVIPELRQICEFDEMVRADKIVRVD
jgi:hypothetical protein